MVVREYHYQALLKQSGNNLRSLNAIINVFRVPGNFCSRSLIPILTQNERAIIQIKLL